MGAWELDKICAFLLNSGFAWQYFCQHIVWNIVIQRASKSGIDLANSSRTWVSADINLGRAETEEIAVKTKQQITSEQAVIAMVTKGRC